MYLVKPHKAGNGRAGSALASRPWRALVRFEICPAWACEGRSLATTCDSCTTMGFFAEFNAWLNALLATYIGDQTARVAAALEPAIVGVATIYVMVWGYLQLTGKIEEP